MKITIEQDFVKITYEFKNIDTSLEQVFDALKGALVSLGWSEITINNFIIELAEELTNKNNYEN
jgi:hypothetical protein